MAIVFLMISRVLYDKGYSQFVEAARNIKKDFPETRFQLLGDIDKEYPNYVPPSIVEEDVKSGIIEYLGYNSNVKPIILEADCVVLPSFYNEGLSRVLMEAMALKKPIITTDIPGCRETVQNGINGFLCLPKDTKSLIEALRKFLSLNMDAQIAMGLEGRKRVEEIFNINKVIDIYHNITDEFELK